MPTGSVTQANMRLSIIAGTAFCDFSSASVLTDYLGYRLEVSDTAGKKLIGYIKAAGTGETLGSELVSNNDFETGDPPTGWSSNNATLSQQADERTGGSGSYSMQIVRNGSGANGGQQLTLGSGGLTRVIGWVRGDGTNAPGFYFGESISVSPLTIGTASSSSTWTSLASGTWPRYRTFTSANMFFNINAASTIGNYVRADDVSVKQVLTPSATGVTITSTADGTTYNWTSEESGFNRNDASGYTYLIQKSLPVFRNQYRFRRS